MTGSSRCLSSPVVRPTRRKLCLSALSSFYRFLSASLESFRLRFSARPSLRQLRAKNKVHKVTAKCKQHETRVKILALRRMETQRGMEREEGEVKEGARGESRERERETSWKAKVVEQGCSRREGAIAREGSERETRGSRRGSGRRREQRTGDASERGRERA